MNKDITKRKGAEMSEFNLKTYLEKKASYEGAQGYFSAQSRAWNNCYKKKLDSDTNASDAWCECLDEYQSTSGNAAWAIKHAGVSADKLQKDAEGSSYADVIRRKIDEGLQPKRAIFEALDESTSKKE